MPLPPKDPENKFWPLPADYDDLHADDQARARVALLMSWHDPNKPSDLITDPAAFIEAFRFYKNVYRRQAPCHRHKYTSGDPAMHREWIRRIAHHRRNVITAWRGSSKTTVLCDELSEFVLTTRPRTAVQYVSASEDLTIGNVRTVMAGLEQNDLLRHDFGELKPTRASSKKWSEKQIELTNGSGMVGFTAFGSQRGAKITGMRFHLQILDDWERDARMKNAELRSDAEDYLFNVLFPMGEPGCWVVWPNTLLHVQAWAMKATNHEDPRFDSWMCGRWDVDYFTDGPPDAEGRPTKIRHSNWPERWPVSDLEAMEGTGNERVVGIGAHSFGQEYRNRPGSKAGSAFEFEPKRHTFYWVGEGSRRMIHDVETGEEFSYEDLKERSICVIGNDLALGKTRGDFCANAACRMDDKGILWVLESWFCRTSPMEALYQALNMGEYWEALALSVERVNFEQVAIDQLNDELNNRRMKSRYAPEVYVCNRAGAEAKSIRALRLQYRFRENLIKVAVAGPGKFPCSVGCTELIEQIQGFTYDRNNLRHDDVLDSLMAAHEAFAGIGQVAFSPARAKGLIDQMRAARAQGMVYWPGSDKADAAQVVNATIRENEAKKNRPAAEDDDFAMLASGFEGDWSDGSIFGGGDW